MENITVKADLFLKKNIVKEKPLQTLRIFLAPENSNHKNIEINTVRFVLFFSSCLFNYDPFGIYSDAALMYNPSFLFLT